MLKKLVSATQSYKICKAKSTDKCKDLRRKRNVIVKMLFLNQSFCARDLHPTTYTVR